MIKNRLIALAYRSTGVIVSLLGLIIGENSPFYYTTQSNVLACALFVLLTICTAVGLRKGIVGSASYLARLQMAVCVTLFFTFAIFWGVIAVHYKSAFSAGSLILHTVTPALTIADRFLFTKKGQIKRGDITIASLIPTLYVFQTIVIGFLGVVTFQDGNHFPYPFMNYALHPIAAPIFTLCIAVLFVSVAIMVYTTDNKPPKPTQPQGQGIGKNNVA